MVLSGPLAENTVKPIPPAFTIAFVAAQSFLIQLKNLIPVQGGHLFPDL